eukprot:767058-Hanusia_phi.AAC.7
MEVGAVSSPAQSACTRGQTCHGRGAESPEGVRPAAAQPSCPCLPSGGRRAGGRAPCGRASGQLGRRSWGC